MFLAADDSRSNFVDLDVPAWAWVALIAVLAVLLAADLIRHRDDHEPTPGEATRETLIWISFGLAFGVVIAVAFGSQAFGEYISGYIIEKSLSFDNVFVWSIIFSSMASSPAMIPRATTQCRTPTSSSTKLAANADGDTGDPLGSPRRCARSRNRRSLPAA